MPEGGMTNTIISQNDTARSKKQEDSTWSSWIIRFTKKSNQKLWVVVLLLVVCNAAVHVQLSEQQQITTTTTTTTTTIKPIEMLTELKISVGSTASVKRVGSTAAKPAFIVKTFRDRWHHHLESYNLFEREVCALNRLQQFPWSPKVLNSSKKTITMSYVGEPLTKENLPTDYAAQFQTILTDMESVGVRHNDIVYPCSKNHLKKHEVMVHEGRLSLVDFGWATIDGGVPCNVSDKLFVKGWKPCADSKMMEVLDIMASKVGMQKKDMPKKEDVQNDDATGLGIDNVCLEAWADWMNKIDVKGDSYKGGGYTDGAGLYRRGMWTYIRVPKANSRLIKETLHKWEQPKVPVTFVLVRHPIDRFISAYGQTEYLMRKMNLRPERQGALKFENHPRGQKRAEIFLVEFLDKTHTDWRHFCDDNKPQTGFAKKCYHGGVGHHLCRTVEIEANRSGWKSASTSKRGRSPMYVGKLETWDESIKALAKVAGVDISVELFNGVNKHSEETKFSAPYKQDLRDVLVRMPHLKLLLEAHFRMDMCLFGYDATPACTSEDTAILESWFAAVPQLVFL